MFFQNQKYSIFRMLISQKLYMTPDFPCNMKCSKTLGFVKCLHCVNALALR